MLSRVAFGTVKNFNRICPSAVGAVRCSTTSTDKEFTHYAAPGTKFPWEGPERDVQNFPRPVQPEEPGQVRFLCIPEEWFQFFYNKTGVTGPYVLGFGVFNYVMSKEWWIIDHEYYYVPSAFILIWLFNKKFGPLVASHLDKEIDKDTKELEADQKQDIQDLTDDIEQEKLLQWQSDAQQMVVDVKRENLGLQLEAIYRERAMHVYEEVKRRLDFQSQKQLMERRISQKHMVNWVCNEVLKSISPTQEKETLKRCISDLQSMVVKAMAKP